jgi:hypothetical protein
LATSQPFILSRPRFSVGHQRAEFALASGQQGDSLFTRRGDSRFETALRKSVFDDALNRIVVFDD